MQPRSFGTHDGTFHADEVTACSLLVLFSRIDVDRVYRTRDPKILETCEYVCDVGGIYDPSQKRFDHHQVEYQGPMSSAGMILLYLKEEGEISEEVYQYFRSSIILGIDAHDNGEVRLEPGVTSFSQVVSNFMPIAYDTPAERVDSAFFEALGLVWGHLKRMLERFEYTQGCKEEVRQVMQRSSELLIFERALPWMENFFELAGEKHPAKFVIMPAKEHWKLRGIPPSLSERMQVRVPLPKSWAGLHEKDLEEVTKIPGSVFCHKGRFISIWETKEAALEAWRKVKEES